MDKKLFKLIPVVVVPLILLMMPVPKGLQPVAWQVLAMYIAAILGLMLRPLPEPIILLSVIGISGLFFDATKLLRGYADSTVWLVFVAFMISQAFIETGLGKRLAYLLIGKFGKSSLGIGYVMTFTDLIISPATPSNTARTGGIVYPIFRSIASTLGSEPGETGRRIGSYLTILAYQVSLSTAALFLTAMAPNALVASFAKSILKVDITWMTWAKAAIVPGMIILLVIPYLLYKIYAPEIKKIDGADELAKKGLEEMGPMSLQEKLLAVLFVFAVVGWATGDYTKISAIAVALAFLSISLLTKIVSWEGILGAKGGWNTLIWYGGIVGLAANLSDAKFFAWLASTVQKSVNFKGINEFVVYFALVIVSLVVRYLFASTGAYVTTFIPVLFTIGLVAKVPAMPLALLIAFSSAFGSLLTHYGGAVGPVLFGTGYVTQKDWWKIGTIVVVLNIIVYFVIGLPYWKIIGLW